MLVFFLRYRHYIIGTLSTIALFVMIYLYKFKGWNIPTVEFFAVLILIFGSLKMITEHKKLEKQQEDEENKNE